MGTVIEFKQKGFQEAIIRFNALNETAKDKRWLWMDFLNFYHQFVADNWFTKGAAYGQRWTGGLSTNYKAWKLNHGGSGALDLYMTGRLKDAAGGGSGSYNTIDKDSVTFGIDVPYAGFLQNGANYRKVGFKQRRFMMAEGPSLPGAVFQHFKDLVDNHITTAGV